MFQRLALTLVHFLWQGAVVSFFASILLRSLRHRHSQARYAVCAAALMALTVCPLVTFFVVDATPADTLSRRVAHSVPVVAESGETRSDLDVTVGDASTALPVDEPSSPESTKHPIPAAVEFEETTAAVAPYLILCWMLGVSGFGLRLLLGFVGVKRLLRDRLEPGKNLTELLRAICRRLKFSTIPRLACSRRVAEAMVVGFFRPVILLPMAWATQMPADVLQSVLAHELAHIRRRDQWVNLLQRVAEVLLFYHPAVWWISRRMRTEREFCCDEAAAAAVGGAVLYAEALETVGRLRVDERTPLLSTTIGGTNMALLSRVKNVLGKPGSPKGRDGWSIGLLAVCVPLMICVSAAWRPTAQAAEDPAAFDGRDERDEVRDRDRDRERARDNERRERNRREEARERDEEGRARDENREREKNARRERNRREEARERDEEGRARDENREREKNARREREERRERDETAHRQRNRERRRRHGDRERGEERRRDGDRRERHLHRDGEGRPHERRNVHRGDRRPDGNIRELMNVIRDLRNEVRRLRKDVDALKRARGIRGDSPRRRNDADRGDSSRPGEGDRPRAGRGDRPSRRGTDEPRTNDRPREGNRPPRRDTDERRTDDRPRESSRPQRPDGEPRRQGAGDSEPTMPPRKR
ncbi:MAG: M56 family metallopeptidase [Planctomycetaceae bacterium]